MDLEKLDVTVAVNVDEILSGNLNAKELIRNELHVNEYYEGRFKNYLRETSPAAFEIVQKMDEKESDYHELEKYITVVMEDTHLDTMASTNSVVCFYICFTFDIESFLQDYRVCK